MRSSLLLQGALGRGEGIGFTLYYATNFIFTGLSVAVAIHAGLFNIGSEGQAYIGGLGCALVALTLDSYVPWYVTMPFAVIGAAVFGAALGFHSRLAAGQARQPCRHHHHHVQLHRLSRDGLSPGARADRAGQDGAGNPHLPRGRPAAEARLADGDLRPRPSVRRRSTSPS